MPWSPFYAAIEVFYGGGQFFLLECQVFSPPHDDANNILTSLKACVALISITYYTCPFSSFNDRSCTQMRVIVHFNIVLHMIHLVAMSIVHHGQLNLSQFIVHRTSLHFGLAPSSGDAINAQKRFISALGRYWQTNGGNVHESGIPGKFQKS